jgi:Family of unknown function (DUF6460)
MGRHNNNWTNARRPTIMLARAHDSVDAPRRRIRPRNFRMNGSTLARLLGGSPIAVALRLFVVSFIVGVILVMWGIEPGDVIDGVVTLFRRLVDFALTDFHQFGRVLLTGAIVVVPIWLLLRLLDARRSR